MICLWAFWRIAAIVNSRLRWRKGTFFFTDSLTEARNGQGQLLGESGLLAAVGKLDISRLDTLGQLILDSIADYREGESAEDDITLLTLYHNATDPPMDDLGK